MTINVRILKDGTSTTKSFDSTNTNGEVLTSLLGSDWEKKYSVSLTVRNGADTVRIDHANIDKEAFVQDGARIVVTPGKMEGGR